ncbi:MAG: hypothetical protein Kow00121_14350 [Elainellaceae cyanobacterium]
MFKGQIQRLLVIGLDVPEALRSALLKLQEWLPDADLSLLGCMHEWTEPVVPIPISVRTCPTIEMQVNEQQQTMQWMRANHFDAAILFTAADRSPYALAYLCYLAGIPIRIGQSLEFGGRVLSHCFPPPDLIQESDRHLNLLHSLIHSCLCDDCES